MKDHSHTNKLLPPQLEARELYMYFGQNTALDNLSFKVSQGEIFCLLGQNGAGKTTTINELLSSFVTMSLAIWSIRLHIFQSLVNI